MSKEEIDIKTMGDSEIEREPTLDRIVGRDSKNNTPIRNYYGIGIKDMLEKYSPRLRSFINQALKKKNRSKH